jgi:hypothetical protein
MMYYNSIAFMLIFRNFACTGIHVNVNVGCPLFHLSLALIIDCWCGVVFISSPS